MRQRLLVTEWRVKAAIDEVADILSEPERLPDWWGAVYLEARIVEPGRDDGVGRRVRFLSRGWLPYALRWEAEVISADAPHGWTIRATGDLTGTGIWRLRQEGEVADIRYDWSVAVGKPVLRQLTPVLWPAFAANHRWAMARGLEGLTRELARRRGSQA